MLSDRQIARRVLDQACITFEIDPSDQYEDVWAIARRRAIDGMRAREIRLVLADLAGLLPAWPEDPDFLIWIAAEADKLENSDG